MRRSTLCLVLVASALFLGANFAHATVLSVTNHQGVGPTLDLDATRPYTHLLDFPADGSSAAINGVQFSPVGAGSGVDPATGKGYSLTMPNPSNWGSGSSVMYDFIHNGGQPAGAVETVELSGLTPGATYEARLYYRNFGPRPNDVSIDTDGAPGAEYAGVLDQATSSDENYWAVRYVAQSPTVTFDFSQQQFNNSWHQYAVSNEDLDAPPIFRFIPINNDADSEISAAKTYTHAVDFGQQNAFPVASVNGVDFVARAGAGSLPPGGSATVGLGASNIPTQHSGNGGAPTGIAPGSAVENLVQDFNYNNSNAEIRIDGLTIGQTYDLRLYQSVWGGNRTQLLGFDTDGVGDPDRTISFNIDDPAANPPGVGTNTYAMSYAYTAESPSLWITAQQQGDGSYHVYGLTNELTGPTVAPTGHQTIGGRVFSTGVDANGNVLAAGSVDPHYRVAETPGNPAYNQPSIVQQNHPAWLANDPVGSRGSSFTSIVNPGTTGIPAGNYVTATTFSLAGWEASTASIAGSVAVDNSLADVRLNGASLGITAGGFTGWTDFAIPTGSSFQAGDNTIEFVWNNALPNNNPGGLRVELAATAVPIHAPGILRYIPINNDADSEISADKTYTHAVDFGNGSPGANINGVQFTRATTGTLPANIRYDVDSGGRNDHGGNGNHNVSGAVVDLFTDMIYNGGNAPGGSAKVTVEGLIPGVEYDTRFYTRQWGAGGIRTSTISFDTNNNNVADTVVTINQDDASASPPGFSDANQAYAISYRHTAQAGQLTATFTQANQNWSWHQYGVTNELIAETATIKVRATADDSYQLLVSGIPGVRGGVMGSAGDWTNYEDWTFEVPIGQPLILQVIAANGGVSPSGFIAQLESEMPLAETGSTLLYTDALLWGGNLTGLGGPMGAVTDLGAYGVGPWGTVPGVGAFDPDAHWIWLGGGNRPAGEVAFLSTQFTVLPEPTTALLLIGGLAALARRRRRKA